MVIGSRTVLKQSFIHGRSKCDHCQETISPLALMPVLGYFIASGKCQRCQQNIPSIYPLCEGFFAILSLLLFKEYHIDIALYLFIIFAILLCMTSADLALHIIPDRFQVMLSVLVIVYYYRHPDLSIGSHILFALLITTTLITSNYILHQGIGGGDIKSLAILAVFLGPLPFSYLLLVASGLALCHVFYLRIRQFNTPKGLPFIPYIFFAYPIIFYIL